MEELMELLRMEHRREELSPGRRIRKFQERIQRAKNGEEMEIGGFITGRKAPKAPRDALYLLLSPIPPSELSSLNRRDFRTYLVVRVDERTRFLGEVKPGNYVLLKGTVDAYPLGNLRMLAAREIEGLDYSDYWKDYAEFALSRKEVEGLFEDTLYLRDDMRNALIYSLHGAPYLPGRDWGEGFEFAAFKYRDDSSVLALWKALTYLYSRLPWEVKLLRERVLEVDDPLLGIDFRLGNPNGSDIRYYLPRTRRGLTRPPKWALRIINGKRAVGLLPEETPANPIDSLARISETPFVMTQGEERPYFEENREFIQLIPNLLVSIFIGRDRAVSLDGRRAKVMEEEFLRWLRESRDEYGDSFRALTAPSGLMNVKLRAELGKRLFGSVVRFEGRATKRAARKVRLMNDALVNDWMTVLNDHPDIKMRLLREYNAYIPGMLKAQRALEVLQDVVSVSSSEETTREEFINALILDGFSKEEAEEITERFIELGYVYEPFPGRLRMVR